jgi:hypothetical protein
MFFAVPRREIERELREHFRCRVFTGTNSESVDLADRVGESSTPPRSNDY